jgi:2-amino-4-hydroxy-6-hydroxymethyldihydropteridine diphosphokinase
VGCTAYIGLGANLGDRARTLAEAWARIQAGCGPGRLSRIYETEPQHLAEQPAYLNAAAEITTGLAPGDLLDALLGIEKALGRDRSVEVRMGPRPIDLDILLYDRLVSEDERLCIPHPRMGQRRFVLVPLLELAPGLTDPRTGRSWAELLPAVAGQGVYLRSCR